MNLSTKQTPMVKMYKIDKLSKIVFLGTPEFAVNSLVKLIKSKYKPCLIITQPDKPRGRRRKLQPTPVKVSGLKHGVPVLQPPNINSEEVLKQISTYSPDIIVTVAYGGFLGKKLRRLAPLGCINLHPSLLPQYRGASPLQSALFDNLKTTGISIFKIVAAMDAGPIINKMKLDIPAEMNFTEFSDYAAEVGADFLIETLQQIESDGFVLEPQDHSLATQTKKVEKEDLLIDWASSCAEIIGKIRGLSEQPGARTLRDGSVLQILRAQKYSDNKHKFSGVVTEVIKNEGFVVSCSDGEILVTEVKPQGKRSMSAFAYTLGANFNENERLG